MSDGDISRLPKWAQRHIEKLESDLVYNKEKLRQISEGDSNVRVVGLTREEDIYLPHDSDVAFITDTKQYGGGDYTAEAGFQVRIREGRRLRFNTEPELIGGKPQRTRVRTKGLEVMGLGAGILAVQPQASNAVFIEAEEL